MRTLYFDCSMGAAGDMLSASLIDLFDDKEKIVEELNSLGITHVKYEIFPDTKCGIVGTHMKVTVDGVEESEEMHDHHHEHHHEHEHEHHHHDHEGHHHHHTSLHDIEHIVRDHMKVCNNVTQDILGIYKLIAEAESDAHGKTVEEIHFHEVGTMDAVADITAFCYLLDKLQVKNVISSAVCVGSGTVKCAHGTLPVPAPATAFILKGVPTYAGEIKSEMCTPTGAAILKYFSSKFDVQPMMIVDRIGYGTGKKDFDSANVVRAMLGEINNKESSIVELNANVDDMTGEEIGFAMERLFDVGARDVFTVPVTMKKSRPGILLSVICDKEKEDEIVRTIFKYTSTIGVREKPVNRFTLDRRTETLSTPYGDVRVKISEGYGVVREKIEYDDLSNIAMTEGTSIGEIKKEIRR